MAAPALPFASQRFATTTEELEGGTPVISVTGEIDLATAPRLEQALLGAAASRTGEVIVDLSRCSFLDSRGLRVLLATRAHLERSDRAMPLVLSAPTLLRVFRIMQVEDLFEMYPTLGAVAARDGQGDGDGVAHG